MKHLIVIISFCLITSLVAKAQVDAFPDVKKITDFIFLEHLEGFKSIETDKVFTDLSGLPKEGIFVFRSPYRNWYYWNGVLNIAMIKLSKQIDDDRYKDFALQNYKYIFDNYGSLKQLTDNGRLRALEQHWEMGLLDHCGAMTAGLLEVYKLDDRKDYREFIDKVADYIMNKEKRMEDGTLSRNFPHEHTIWLDDLYMSVPFLARMGQITGEQKYFDFAAKQVKQFTKYLYNDHTGLYYHCYYGDLGRAGVAHWGRANGWSIVAQADLLEFLPEDHPDREELLKIFRQQVLGFSQYQSETGLWHQVLNREDSYLETSCTAMFTYAVAKAVNKGWMDPRYQDIALQGWKGIETMINEKGQVENICIGTGTSTSMVHYYKRPVQLNDIHGLGAVLLAGVEIMKLRSLE